LDVGHRVIDEISKKRGESRKVRGKGGGSKGKGRGADELKHLAARWWDANN